MVVVTKKTKQGFIWIPRPYTPNFKVLINSVDVTVDVLYCEFTRPCTTEIGVCKLNLYNGHKNYSQFYDGGETIQIYLDMGTATTLQFTGFIEAQKTLRNGGSEELEIQGLHDSGKLLDMTVTKTYSGETLATILNDLRASYASWVTLTNVSTALTDTITISWNNKPFWECIIDLCNILSADAYLDNTDDLHMFAQDSIECTMDAVVLEDNVIGIEGLGTDKIEHKNKVIVYGKDNLVWVSEDTTASAGYYVKEHVIRDDDVQSQTEAKALADAKLLELAAGDLQGSAKATLLPYLNPGEKLWISIPTQKIHGQYRAINIKHVIERSYFVTTEVTVMRTGFAIPKFMKDRLKRELSTERVENINEMKYSYYFSFDDNSNVNTMTDLTITESKLKVSTGKTSGTLYSNTYTHSADATYAEARIIGENLSASKFYVSTDNGITYTQIYHKTKTAIPNGLLIKIKIELIQDAASTNPEIESFCLLYK